MPDGLDILKDNIWDNLRGRINPRTRERYTEGDAWAIATARWEQGQKAREMPEGPELEEPSDLLTHAIEEMEVE